MEKLIWVVPAIVLAAGLGSPRAGLMALAASLPLFGSPPGGPYLGALDVAALSAIATSWRAGSAPASRLDWPVWVFVAVSSLSLVPFIYHPPSWEPRVLLRLLATFPAVEPWTPLYGWRAMLNLLLGLGLFHAVRRAFGARPLKPLLVALSVGLGVTLVAGLAEHAGLIDLDALRTKGGPRWESRMHSFFFHSGWLAEYLVLAGPVAVATLAMMSRRWRAAATPTMLLVLLGAFVTEQRGALLAVLGQLLVAWLIIGRPLLRDHDERWRILRGLLAMVGVVATIWLVRPDFFEGAIARARYSLNLWGRPFIWELSGEMSFEKPLLGWGIGSFSPVYREVFDAPFWGDFDWLTAHNHYLMLTVERGLVGFAAFVLIGIAFLGILAANLRDRRAPEYHLAAGLAVSCAGMLIYGLAQYFFFLKTLELLFWLLLGAAATLAPRTGLRPLDKAACALAILAVLIVPLRLVSSEPLGLEGDRSFGFHAVESSEKQEFQWTERYAAKRLQRKGEHLRLGLANGHPRPDRHRVEVVVRVDGRERLREVVPGAWSWYEIPLEPSRREDVLLEIEARPTFRPFSDFRGQPDLEPSVDVRSLGVAVARESDRGPR